MQNVYKLPDENHKDYNHKVEFLLWYVDVYLPATAGENYGGTKRRYKMAVDRMEIRGKQRVLVESATEAYGWLLLDNCHSKWKAFLEEYTKNTSFKIPNYNKDDKSTHPFHVTKYSEAHAGQGKGWKSSALLVLDKYRKAIVKFREEDHKNAWKMHSFALDLIRNHHGVTVDEPPTRKNKGRKRKARELVEEEEEDDFEMDYGSDADYS